MTSLVQLGQIITAHGIKGQVKIKILTEHPHYFTDYGQLINEKQEPVIITSLVVKSPFLAVASIKGITTRNQAEVLKGSQLFIVENQLPPLSDEELYRKKLIGLPLIAEGETLGHVVAVCNFGAGDFCEVRTNKGKIGTVHLSSCTVDEDKIECPQDHFLV
jgi:16S rRNA processing protein RimM